MEESEARFLLNASDTFNLKQQYRIIHQFGSALNFLQSEEESCQFVGREQWFTFLRTCDRINHNQSLQQLIDTGVRLLLSDDPEYPPHFNHVDCPPHLLYVKGKLPEMSSYSLSIIGTRRPTIYGRQMAQSFASALASEGMTIISGLAKGIDGVALQSAVQCGGPTIALLGTGIDKIYPRENEKLFEKICINGCLVSEFAPGSAPLKHHFPWRNRLISAWSLGVLVVEASIRSGTMRTVEWALEQGKDCFAIPGPANSEVSAGPHKMIREGAHLVEHPEEILDFYQNIVSAHQKPHHEESIPTQAPHQLEQDLGLDYKPKSIDELIESSEMEYTELTQKLNHAIILGQVKKHPGETYSLLDESN